MEKVGYKLGILGGMGPAATSKLFQRIIDKTTASSDQEHIEMVILNKCSIPDRTKALLNHEESPIDKINEGIEELIKLNCEYFIIPCNTAHAYKKEFKNLDKIKFIDMIDNSIDYVHNLQEEAVVLCTNGTRKVNVYNDPLLTYPDDKTQDKVMEIVTNIKAGLDQREELNKIIKDLDKNVLLACTELSIYYGNLNSNHYILDSMELLIDKIIEICK